MAADKVRIGFNLMTILVVLAIIVVVLRFRKPIMDFLGPLPLIGGLLDGNGGDGGNGNGNGGGA